MKRAIPFILISLYFFSFLIQEIVLANLAWDRKYPQLAFISIINLCSFIYFFKINKLYEFFLISKKNNLLKAYSIFLIFCFISILNSENISESIIVLSSYITYFLSFLFIYFNSILIGKKRFIKSVITLLFAAILIESFAVIYSAINIKFLDQGLVERTLDIRGFSGNINITAFSIVLKIPVLMYLIFRNSNKYILFMSYLILFLSFCSVLILLSRGALVSLIVIHAIFIFLKFRILNFKKALFYLLVIVSSYLVSENIFLSQNNNQILERVTSINPNSTDDSISDRLRYYSHAVESIKKHPLTGIGVGNWKLKSVYYDAKNMPSYTVPLHVHNDFLQVFAEIGILGFLAYLYLFLTPIILSFIKYLKNKNDDFNILIILMMSSYFIDSFFNFPISRVISHMSFVFILVLFININKNLKITNE
jgi:O-antigen ligase